MRKNNELKVRMLANARVNELKINGSGKFA